MKISSEADVQNKQPCKSAGVGRAGIAGLISWFDKDHLIRHSSLLMLSSLIASVLNLVFQMVMGRCLAAEEFGAVGALFGLLLMVCIPAGAIQMCMANYAATARASGGNIYMEPIVKFMLLVITPIAIITVALVLAFVHEISSSLRFSSNVPVLLVLVFLVSTLCTQVSYGVAHGLQYFGTVSLAGVMSSLARVVVAYILIVIGFRITGPLIASIIMMLIFFLITWGRVRRDVAFGLSADNGMKSFKEILSYFWPALIAFGVITVYMYFDTVLARYVFDPYKAGLYIQAGSIARIVAFIAGTILTAMFPKVVNAISKKKDCRLLFVRSMALSLVIVASISLFCCVFPSFLAKIIFKTSSAELDQLIRYSVVAFLPVPLFNLLLFFLMARRVFRFLIFELVICSIYILVLLINQPTVNQMLLAIGAFSLVAFLVALYYSFSSLSGGPGSDLDFEPKTMQN